MNRGLQRKRRFLRGCWLLVAWVATTRLPRPFLYNPGLANTSPKLSNLPFGNKSSLKTLSIDPSHATIGIHHVVYAVAQDCIFSNNRLVQTNNTAQGDNIFHDASNVVYSRNSLCEQDSTNGFVALCGGLHGTSQWCKCHIHRPRSNYFQVSVSQTPPSPAEAEGWYSV